MQYNIQGAPIRKYITFIYKDRRNVFVILETQLSLYPYQAVGPAHVSLLVALLSLLIQMQHFYDIFSMSILFTLDSTVIVIFVARTDRFPAGPWAIDSSSAF